MPFSQTARFVRKGLRVRPHRRFRGQPHKQWDRIRGLLDKLIRLGRISTTLAKCKELQPYAEELINYAKKDDYKSNLKVESIVRTARARRIVYEKLVPRYIDRQFLYTRVVNQHLDRFSDAASMGYIEFVDRPGELFPASPVGMRLKRYLFDVMKHGSRRDRRKFWNQAVLQGVIGEDGLLIEDVEMLNDRKMEWNLYNEVPREKLSGVSSEDWDDDGEEAGEVDDPNHQSRLKKLFGSESPSTPVQITGEPDESPNYRSGRRSKGPSLSDQLALLEDKGRGTESSFLSSSGGGRSSKKTNQTTTTEAQQEREDKNMLTIIPSLKKGLQTVTASSTKSSTKALAATSLSFLSTRFPIVSNIANNLSFFKKGGEGGEKVDNTRFSKYPGKRMFVRPGTATDPFVTPMIVKTIVRHPIPKKRIKM